MANVSEPMVTVVAPDGQTDDGQPYMDLSDQLGDGFLSPGESIATRVYFANPMMLRFECDLEVLGVIEQAQPAPVLVGQVSLQQDAVGIVGLGGPDPDVVGGHLVGRRARGAEQREVGPAGDGVLAIGRIEDYGLDLRIEPRQACHLLGQCTGVGERGHQDRYQDADDADDDQ